MPRLPDSSNPLFNPGFLDLSFESDSETILSGELGSRPGGVRALDGDDNVTGAASAELINGNKGSDLINAGDGDDTLRGGADSDNLLSGNGNDILIGDRGADGMKGGAGSDIFVMRTEIAVGNEEFDIIADFELGVDRIGLTGGLTVADLVFEDLSVSVLNVPQKFGGGSAGLLKAFAVDPTLASNADPNGDGIVTGVLFSTKDGRSLGGVLNQTAASLSGSFVPFV